LALQLPQADATATPSAMCLATKNKIMQNARETLSRNNNAWDTWEWCG